MCECYKMKKSLYAPTLPQMNVMLDFICIGSVDLRGERRKRKTTK